MSYLLLSSAPGGSSLRMPGGPVPRGRVGARPPPVRVPLRAGRVTQLLARPGDLELGLRLLLLEELLDRVRHLVGLDSSADQEISKSELGKITFLLF